MCDCVDQDVEDDGREDPVSADQWEEGLSLPAEADFSFAVVAADVFAEGWVLDEDAQREQAELGVVSYPHRAVRVLQEIG